jgi:tetratricopeptide (TPR) repeat protein
MASFDPYHIWLGIPAEDQPPNHYRLLAIPELEANPDVIDGAAEQRTIYLRTFQTGDQAQLAEQLLNEVSAARICLLNAEQKVVYDQQLEAEIQPAPTPTPAVPPPSRPTQPTQPIWQQPRILAVTGGAVAVILLLVILNSGGDKTAVGKVAAAKAATEKADKQPIVLPKETQKEREEEVQRLVEELVRKELLKAEQERPAALTAEEEKAAVVPEAEIKRLVADQVKEELLKAEQERLRVDDTLRRQLVVLAKDNIEQKRFAIAIVLLEDAIRLNSDIGVLYYDKGRAHAGMQNHHRAVVDFTKAIELNQGDPSFLASCYHRRGVSHERLSLSRAIAIEDYTAAIKLLEDQDAKELLEEIYDARNRAIRK